MRGPSHVLYVYEYRDGYDKPYRITCSASKCDWTIAQRAKGNCHTAARVHLMAKNHGNRTMLPSIVGWNE